MGRIYLVSSELCSISRFSQTNKGAGNMLTLGLGTAGGGLLGVVAVFWIEPSTSGGVALCMIVPILMSTILGRAIKALCERRRM